MALKFLNKKGWHTGSLRNIETVWKAEQKNDAEKKKLEELRKQIHEERERSEFRQLQEAAGLVPRQERLDFLYESGLAVGKGSSEGFKALQSQPSGGASSSAAEPSLLSKAVVPGALFEDKPQSASDAWRKLHSDPLLLIRQREQEALAKIKNNPIRMDMIRKSAESEKKQEEVKKASKKKRNKHHHAHSKSKNKDQSKYHSDSEYCSDHDRHNRPDRSSERSQHNNAKDKEGWRSEEKRHTRMTRHDNCIEKHEKNSDEIYSLKEQKERRNGDYTFRDSNDQHSSKSSYSGSKHRIVDYEAEKRDDQNSEARGNKRNCHNIPKGAPKMTEEEREARLREMKMDAELHEEQRWKRLRKAAEADAIEAKQAPFSRGKSFLNTTQRSVYGMEEGGRSTIEESVRRRTHYSQGHSAHESNAFRR